MCQYLQQKKKRKQKQEKPVHAQSLQIFTFLSPTKIGALIAREEQKKGRKQTKNGGGKSEKQMNSRRPSARTRQISLFTNCFKLNFAGGPDSLVGVFCVFVKKNNLPIGQS